MRKSYYFILCLMAFSHATWAKSERSNLQTVERFVNAYNQQSLALMTSIMAQDIKWMSISDHQMTVETNNKVQLTKAMADYFGSGAATTSSLTQVIRNGDFVSTVERATWFKGGQEKSQCSVAVYQVVDQLIHNVWYYSAQACD